eukprot:366161-Chlamydomonas_euryale.AAC.3
MWWRGGQDVGGWEREADVCEMGAPGLRRAIVGDEKMREEAKCVWGGEGNRGRNASMQGEEVARKETS